MIDASTITLYAAPFGLAMAAARGVAGRRRPRPSRLIRRLVKQSASRTPQPEVQQRPDWGAESQLNRPWWEA